MGKPGLDRMTPACPAAGRPMVPERIDPANLRKAAEIGVVRVDGGVILDGQSTKLDIGGQVLSGAHPAE